MAGAQGWGRGWDLGFDGSVGDGKVPEMEGETVLDAAHPYTENG